MGPQPFFSKGDKDKTREELVEDLEKARAEIARLKDIIAGQSEVRKALPAKRDEEVRLECAETLKEELAEKQWALEALNENPETHAEELSTRNEELLDAREALRKTEEEFRTIFDRAGVAIFMADAGTGEIIDCNAKAEELAGRPREEIVGFHHTMLHPSEMASERSDVFSRSAQCNSITNDETVVQHRDGRVIPVIINAARITVNGRAVMLGFFMDITERKWTEEALQLTQFALDNFPDSAIWLTPDGSIAYVNQAACDTLGYSREELLSMHISDIDPNYTPEKFQELWPKKLQGRHINFESKHVTRDGRVFPVEITSCYTRSGDKDLLITFDRDISERKRAEETLKNNLAVLAKSQEIGRLGSWTIDCDSEKYDVSDEIYRIYGFVPGSVEPTKNLVYEVTYPDDRERYLEYVESTQREGQPGGMDYRVVWPNGSVRYIHVFTDSHVRGPEGRIMTTSGIVQDITERKRAEREINEARMQAELYLDLMGHDICNMNQVGMGYLELALGSPDIDKKDKEFLLKSMGSLENSTRLIENVRKMQKVRIGEFKLYELDACQVIQRVVGHYSNSPGTNAAIYCEIPNSCMVMANDLLYEVFENLVVNAIKHAGPEPTVNVNLETTLVNGENHYRFTVEDNGPGIPDDSKESIFNRLQRGQTKARGIGLGLYIVRSLVESYHGKVWAEDRIKGDHTQGARFVVMLPTIKIKAI